MKQEGFIITPFALIATFFVVAAAVSTVIYFKPFELRTIEQRSLSTVKNLKGTWIGTGSFVGTRPGVIECTSENRVTLVINDQDETTFNGTVTFDIQKVTGCTFTNNQWAVPIKAELTGTKISSLVIGIIGTFAGSYTQDTITLNQAVKGESDGAFYHMIGSINLLRQ